MKFRYSLSFLLTMMLFLGAGLAIFKLKNWQAPKKPDALKSVAVNLSMFQVNPIQPKPIKKPKQSPKPAKPIKPKKTPPKIVHKKVVHKKIVHKKIVHKPLPKLSKPHPKQTSKPVSHTISKPLPKPLPKPSLPLTKKMPAPSPAKMPSPKPKYSSQAIASAEQTYLHELASILAQGAKDSYPTRAKRRHWQGTVKLEFTLLPNGQIIHAKIKQATTRELLNEAALSIIHEYLQDYFKPFPKEIERDHWTIEVPIEYQLR